MRWLLVPVFASLPFLGVACTDSQANNTPEKNIPEKNTPEKGTPEKKSDPSKSDNQQANASAFALTYFTMPG